MKVLILGSGGREHAMAWKICQSSLVSHLFIAPGNPGTAGHGINVPLEVMDFLSVANFCAEHQVEMIIIGSLAPLAGGLRDFLEKDRRLSQLIIVGPGKAGARLESSLDMAKSFMIRHGIPTARYGSFDYSSANEALAFLDTIKGPYVIKSDAITEEKAVVIAEKISSAREILTDILTGERSKATGQTVVIEEFMEGKEFSVAILTDGSSYKLLPEARDYRHINEGDSGPITAGVGAVSPAPFCDAVLMQRTEEQIIKPTLRGLAKDEILYTGFILFRILLFENRPYLIEYAARMGDTETAVILPRIKSDLANILTGLGDGTFSESDLVTEDRFATTLMLFSRGYPGPCLTGKKIEGLDAIRGCVGFHGGTKRQQENTYTAEGRVLSLTALGKTFEQALDLCYANAEVVTFEGKSFREDIGEDLF